MVGLFGSMSSGMLYIMILKILVWNLMFVSSFSHIFVWLGSCESQMAVWSLSASIKVPPFHVKDIVLILPDSKPDPIMILFSSALNWKGLRYERFESWTPAIANCLALMPSLAASFGFACGGGLINVEAYVLIGCVGWVVVEGLDVRARLWPSCLRWSLIFNLVSSSSSWMSKVTSLIWILHASFTVWLTCVSSSSSIRNTTVHMALIAGFGTPASAEIWYRHVERDWCVTSSPGGQSSDSFSRYFLPSRASLMSWYSSMEQDT